MIFSVISPSFLNNKPSIPYTPRGTRTLTPKGTATLICPRLPCDLRIPQPVDPGSLLTAIYPAHQSQIRLSGTPYSTTKMASKQSPSEPSAAPRLCATSTVFPSHLICLEPQITVSYTPKKAKTLQIPTLRFMYSLFFSTSFPILPPSMSPDDFLT